MELSSSVLAELAELAASAARDAGEMIAQSRPQSVEHKTEATSLASQVVTEVDRAAEDIIVKILEPTLARFELGLLAEESPDDGGRLSADHFWCIDPLDGTLHFIEGTPGYAVSIALVRRDGTPLIGVIYDPVEKVLLHAISGSGVYRNGTPWHLEPALGGETLTLFADRSLLGPDDREVLLESLGHIARDLGLEGVELGASGGAVMNASRALANPPACYFKFPGATGGGSLWDFAATACLFNELGAVATNIHGDRLDLNRADSTFMNHQGVLFATNEALAQRIANIDLQTDRDPS